MPIPKRALCFLGIALFLCSCETAFQPLEAKNTVVINIWGHVKKEGAYAVLKKLPVDASPLIKLAGGFNPLVGYDAQKLTDVVWIEREILGEGMQFIIIDFKSHQILSQRGRGVLLEKYNFGDFEFQTNDGVFVTTGRDSLDIAFWRVRGVGPQGWPQIDELPWVDLNREIPKLPKKHEK